MQNSEESGQNLNPMFYWQFVKGYENRLPCVLVKGNPSDKMREIIANSPEVNFIIEDADKMDLENVLYRQRIKMTENEWLRSLSTIDFLFCKPEDKGYATKVSLCGVKVIMNDKIPQFRVLPYVERIENWDLARNILTA